MSSSNSVPPPHILELLAPLYPSDSQFTSKPSSSYSRTNVESLISSSPSSTDSTSSIRYLYKTVPLSEKEQMRGEAESLKAMGEACAELVPRLIGSADKEDEFWMLSEWHNLSRLSSNEDQTQFARLLAKMHSAPPPPAFETKFGFAVPTHCGVTRQDNEAVGNWAEFWSERRIGDLVRRIGDPEIEELGRQVQRRVIPNLLGNLENKPSILHGDLWSGNVSYSEDRKSPIIFDPSSYYGHSEADLGMTRMFGGFSPKFYEAYHEIVPKSEPAEEYETRLDCYELYHHLNHMLMFGGGYKSGSVRIMKKLIEWADEKGY